MSGGVPCFGLRARRRECPRAQRCDQSGFLGDRDEARRRDDAELRTPPAHERLATGDGAAREVDLRLVMQLEFAVFERTAQGAFEPDALLRLRAHFGGVELN